MGVITPNPKTSGGARWNYLAAWYYFEKQGLSEDEIKEKMKTLYENVAVVDKNGIRDVATEYLNYLYSDEAQWYYRPTTESILKGYTYEVVPNQLPSFRKMENGSLRILT